MCIPTNPWLVCIRKLWVRPYGAWEKCIYERASSVEQCFRNYAPVEFGALSVGTSSGASAKMFTQIPVGLRCVYLVPSVGMHYTERSADSIHKPPRTGRPPLAFQYKLVLQ